MKTNNPSETAQDRIEEFMQQPADDPMLGSLAGPGDAHRYSEAGFSALLNAALLKKRALYPDQNPWIGQACSHPTTACQNDSSYCKSSVCQRGFLFEKLRADYPARVAHLQPRSDHDLRFMNYPDILRRNLRSTNLPDGINNLIEILRRNAGGHFHTQHEVCIKTKLLIDRLAKRKWTKPNPMLLYHGPTLIRLFKQRFESKLPQAHFLTQCF